MKRSLICHRHSSSSSSTATGTMEEVKKKEEIQVKTKIRRHNSVLRTKQSLQQSHQQ